MERYLGRSTGDRRHNTKKKAFYERHRPTLKYPPIKRRRKRGGGRRKKPNTTHRSLERNVLNAFKSMMTHLAIRKRSMKVCHRPTRVCCCRDGWFVSSERIKRFHQTVRISGSVLNDLRFAVAPGPGSILERDVFITNLTFPGPNRTCRRSNGIARPSQPLSKSTIDPASL